MEFNPLQNEEKYSHNKCYDKSVLMEKTLKLSLSKKEKLRKNRTKFGIDQKKVKANFPAENDDI